MAMLSTVSAEDLIGADHPIRRIKAVVDAVLGGLDAELAAMCPPRGRPSVPPEMLLKASVLMALYSVRSERAFCERLNYDMLFKWFLGLRIDERGFDASTLSKNRQRLLDHEIADRFFAAVVDAAKLRRYCSSEHFSVDGTLLEAWASHKSFKPRTGAAAGAASAQPQPQQPQQPQLQQSQPQQPQPQKSQQPQQPQKSQQPQQPQQPQLQQSQPQQPQPQQSQPQQPQPQQSQPQQPQPQQSQPQQPQPQQSQPQQPQPQQSQRRAAAATPGRTGAASGAATTPTLL